MDYTFKRYNKVYKNSLNYKILHADIVIVDGKMYKNRYGTFKEDVDISGLSIKEVDIIYDYSESEIDEGTRVLIIKTKDDTPSFMDDDILTHRGDKIKVSEMTHQHVTNWYWYAKIIMEDTYLTNYWRDVLRYRFDDVLLSYRPVATFEHEINILKEKNLIDEFGYVFYNNREIGRVRRL